MTELNAKQHTLIQALLSRGPLPETQFHRIFSDLTGENPGVRRKAFDDYLLRINKALSYVQFELRGCRNQYDGQVYYGVVNNVSDEKSKLGTTYSVAQIAFYKAIIEAIVQEASQGTISSTDALNLQLENQVNIGTSSQTQGEVHIPAAVKNFSMSQKQKTLDEFVQDRWLSYTAEGRVGLGVRSFLDLRSWFRSNDVPSCEVCNEAGVKAVLCQKEDCKVRIHQYCLGKLFAMKKGETVCPRCGTQWPYARTKAEAVENDDPDQSLPPMAPKRKKLRINQVGDGSVVESNSTQASVPDHNLRRATRSSMRPR